MNCNIEAERGRLQLTKAELSKMLGVTQKTYVSYVNGKTPIPSNVLMSMAKIFRCTTDYLLGLSESDKSA